MGKDPEKQMIEGTIDTDHSDLEIINWWLKEQDWINRLMRF